MKTNLKLVALACMTGVLGVGCGNDDNGGGGDGNLTILITAEETIPDGIPDGGDEGIQDGYSISFDKYIISVGFVDMSMGGSDQQLGENVLVADYTAIPTVGEELDAFMGIPTGQYDQFGYETPVPTSDSIRSSTVSEEDFDLMVENEWTYWIEGTLTSSLDPFSIDFIIQANVPTVYSECGIEGQPLGVAVSTNSSVEATMHGDHLVFNGCPADESNVTRLAQWMADVPDLNMDGVLTQDEFEAADDIGTLFPQDTYDFAECPLAINNAWDFVRAELGTQGHIDGEGECAWSDL